MEWVRAGILNPSTFRVGKAFQGSQALFYVALEYVKETWLINPALVDCVQEVHVCLQSLVNIFLLKSVLMDQEQSHNRSNCMAVRYNIFFKSCISFLTSLQRATSASETHYTLISKPGPYCNHVRLESLSWSVLTSKSEKHRKNKRLSAFYMWGSNLIIPAPGLNELQLSLQLPGVSSSKYVVLISKIVSAIL